MPSSSVRSFTDPDEYAEAVQRTRYELTVRERGQFSAHLVQVALPHLFLRHFSEQLQRIAQIESSGELTSIGFLTHGAIITSGTPVSSTNIIARTPRNQSHHLALLGPASYGTMALPSEQMNVLSEAMVGRDLTAPDEFIHVAPPPSVASRLLRLHAATMALAEDAPHVLAHPEAAHGLEQALIEALMDSLALDEVQEDRAAKRRHAAIMRRFHRSVEKHLDEPLYIPELCREIGASVRTLSISCQEHLGMGPKHYLLLRRMHMVRRALRQSAPADTTVTEVATRYGFWQLGRLSVEYKALFGESPSDTLARVE